MPSWPEKRELIGSRAKRVDGPQKVTGAAKYAAERTGDVKHSLADISLAQKHLGYSPEVSFQEGLRRTVEWYQQQAVAPAVPATTASSR